MRRKDREITDNGKIREIIAGCECCRLGLVDNGRAYIVPLSFGEVEHEGKYTFYFHGAKEGRKLDLIRQNGWAGFEMDRGYTLHGADTACSHSAAFESIIGGGTVTIVETEEEKRAGLQAIMAHATGKTDWEFDSRMVDSVCVIRLDVDELSCKVHL